MPTVWLFPKKTILLVVSFFRFIRKIIMKFTLTSDLKIQCFYSKKFHIVFDLTHPKAVGLTRPIINVIFFATWQQSFSFSCCSSSHSLSLCACRCGRSVLKHSCIRILDLVTIYCNKTNILYMNIKLQKLLILHEVYLSAACFHTYYICLVDLLYEKGPNTFLYAVIIRAEIPNVHAMNVTKNMIIKWWLC